MRLKAPKIIRLGLLAAVAALAVVAVSCGKSGTETKPAEKILYTCGMHPQVIQDKPGNCPICGMKLTPIRKQPAPATNAARAAASPGERTIKYYKSTMTPGEISSAPGKDSMGMDLVPVYEDPAAVAEPSAITIDPVMNQNMGIRTGVVTRGPLRRVIRSVAVIDYNETALADVTTKFKGWIDKLYVNTTGDLVMRGDPLFEIYSPELYSAQVEYVLALNQPTNISSGSAQSLKASARAKLKFLDISDDQIAAIEKDRAPQKSLRINAPIDGFVVEKPVVQGQMVDAGMKLYRLADLGMVWVQAQVYEQDLAYLKLGQEATVTLSYLPDRKFRGRVTYIYPMVDEKTRTAKVRMEFHNPGYFLKPGMFATVDLTSETAPSVLLVPDMAVLRSGEKNTVFVALEGGRFEPRTVALGLRAENNMYQVLAGLQEGERVVTSGQFMLDSESQLREAIQKMNEPGKAAAATAPMAPETNSTNAPAASGSRLERTVYICPMPEHVSVQYDHPGQCPLCGMALVPVTQSLLDKIQPGGKVEYYTCPMPEHGDVRLDKPGKCPRCGMTLIPVMSAPDTNVSSAGAKQSTPVTSPLFFCLMHPDVVFDQPGKCPQCGMDLVEASDQAQKKIAEESWRKAHSVRER